MCVGGESKPSQQIGSGQTSEPNIRKVRLGTEEGRSDPAASEMSSLTGRSIIESAHE